MPEITTKEYLKRALYLKRDINRRHEQIAALQAMAGRATSSYSALRHGGSSRRSKVEDSVVAIDEIAAGLARDMAAFTKVYNEISSVIDRVDNPKYRELLTLRYLCFKSWEEISVIMGYSGESISWIHKMHGRALQKLDIERHTLYVI